MYYTEKDTLDSRGCRLVPIEQLFRYEPTTRKLPISRGSTQLSKARPSSVDVLAGTQAFGNTTLYKTRVIVVGARTDFERTLQNVVLRTKKFGDGRIDVPLDDAFAWGAFDTDGHPMVLHPT